MDNLNLMEYWLNSSDEDYNVMQYLYKGKKNSYCLFFGHLVIEKLQIITQFNISARYDDYKETINKKCTDEYTKKQVENIEEVRTWLKKLLMTK